MKVYCRKIDAFGNYSAVAMHPDWVSFDRYGVAMIFGTDFLVSAAWEDLTGCDFFTDSYIVFD